MSAHQHDGRRPEHLGECGAEHRRVHQHVRLIAAGLADFEQRHCLGEESPHVRHRPERRAGHAERQHRGRMAVHDCHDFGPRLVDLGMNEALAEHPAVALVERLAVEPELHHVAGGDHRGTACARHEETPRIGWRAEAQVTKAIGNHALIGQNAIADDEVLGQLRHRGLRLRRLLRTQ
jgi:hypothetical protein